MIFVMNTIVCLFVILLKRSEQNFVDYTDIIYMSNMLKVYELFCLYLFVVLNLGRMNEMRDCNLKFGVVTLYYIGVIRNRYYLFLVLFIC